MNIVDAIEKIIREDVRPDIHGDLYGVDHAANAIVTYVGLWQSYAEIERLRQQNAELVEALRPFAKLASIYDPPEDDDDDITWYRRSTPTLGQLRTARAVIIKATGGE